VDRPRVFIGIEWNGQRFIVGDREIEGKIAATPQGLVFLSLVAAQMVEGLPALFARTMREFMMPPTEEGEKGNE